jgi:Ni,Fe-hydrogenase III small subunit/formate hydrogenlyase subunit 6/NADH:ubiquinone oxidoreductase subunit I
MSMLTVLRAAFRVGRVTTAYPAVSSPAPPAFRGAPSVDPARCDDLDACLEAAARVCPTGSISSSVEPDGGRTWQIDLAPCVFCGLCAEACPSGAIAMSGEYELAARSRQDLLTIVRRGKPLTPQPPHHSYHGAPFPHGAAEGEGEQADALGRELGDRISSKLRRSLHIRHMDTGSDNSTDWELNTLLNPVYDIQRLGIDIVASPRHADLLFVTGPVTRNLAPALRRTYEAMPRPAIVVAAGAEACGGGVLQGSYAHAGGVDRVLPVDVYIPGDPPRPEAIIYGLLLAMGRVEQKRRRIELTV